MYIIQVAATYNGSQSWEPWKWKPDAKPVKERRDSPPKRLRQSIKWLEVILDQLLPASLAPPEGQLQHRILWSSLRHHVRMQNARQNLHPINNPASAFVFGMRQSNESSFLRLARLEHSNDSILCCLILSPKMTLDNTLYPLATTPSEAFLSVAANYMATTIHIPTLLEKPTAISSASWITTSIVMASGTEAALPRPGLAEVLMVHNIHMARFDGRQRPPARQPC